MNYIRYLLYKMLYKKDPVYILGLCSLYICYDPPSLAMDVEQARVCATLCTRVFLSRYTWKMYVCANISVSV